MSPTPVLTLSGICVQLLALPRFRLNTYGCRAFSVVGPTVWNSLTDWDPAISADCLLKTLKRIYSLDPSAFSAVEILDDNRAVEIRLLTYLR